MTISLELTMRWLRKSGRFYLMLQRVLYAGLYFSEKYLLGTKLHEILWRARWFEKLGTCGDCDAHRAFLADRAKRFAPFDSILEVGCGAGGNLVVLARANRSVQFYGVDISARAVKAAQNVLACEAIDNAVIFVCRGDDLRCFADKSVDIILTDANLMYVGPDKLESVMSELVRVARKGLILNEWHLFEGDSGGSGSYWYYAHWVHDYRRVLYSTPSVKTVRVERLPVGLWPSGGGWEAYGALIEAEL